MITAFVIALATGLGLAVHCEEWGVAAALATYLYVWAQFRRGA